MISLKKTLIVSAMSVATVAGVAGAASAQPGRYYDRGNYDQRFDRGARLDTAYVDSLDWRISNAAREGRISWREARDLQAMLRDVKPLAWRYQTGEARPWEVNRLQRTVDRIRSEIRG